MYRYGYKYPPLNRQFFNPLTDIVGLKLYNDKSINVNTKIAAAFTSNNDYLSSSSTDFDKGDTDYSVTCWVWINSTASPNTRYYFTKYEGVGNYRFALTGIESTGLIRLVYSLDGTAIATLGTRLVTRNAWHKIRFYHDSVNDLLSLKVDNLADETVVVAGGLFSGGTVPLKIGTWVSMPLTNGLNGRVDQAVWHNKVLTAQDDSDMWNSGNGLAFEDYTPSLLTSVVSGYKLNETTGTRIDYFGTNDLTDNNSVGYNLGIVQEPSTIGELVYNWIDGKSLYVFEHADSTEQPILAANSINNDGVNDGLSKVIANPFSTDTSGIVFFSGYADGTLQYYFSSADTATDLNYIAFGKQATGEVFIQNSIAGVVSTIKSTNTVAPGAYFHAAITSTDTAYLISLYGIDEVLQITGNNDGTFFGDFAVLDNLTFGYVDKLTPIYSTAKINRLIYTSDYTIANRSQIYNLMSTPNN